MEYLKFLKYPSLDVGSVIKYIMTRKGMTGRQLAKLCGLPPQRISDFMNNHRRISAEVSLAMENALGITENGYFYIIQSNHDVYETIRRNRQTPDLNKISQHVFWDSDIAKINWQASRSRIIQRVFEYGDEQTINEIIRFYGRDIVKKILGDITDGRFANRREQNYKLYL